MYRRCILRFDRQRTEKHVRISHSNITDPRHALGMACSEGSASAPKSGHTHTPSHSHSTLRGRLRERYHEFMMTEWPSTIPEFGGVRSVGWLGGGGCAQTAEVRELSVESLWVAGGWGLRTEPDHSGYIRY